MTRQVNSKIGTGIRTFRLNPFPGVDLIVQTPNPNFETKKDTSP